MNDTIEDIRARHATTTLRADGSHAAFHAHYDRATLLAEVDRLTRELDEARAEVDRLRAEKDKLRDEKEALHVAVARIERAAAGAIYSQESIYVMASSALEALEDKR